MPEPQGPPFNNAGQYDAKVSEGTTDSPSSTSTPAPAQFSHPDEDEAPTRRRRYVRAPTVRLTGEPQLTMYGTRVAAEFPFTIGNARDLETVTISGKPSVFIDGGKETEPPLHAAMPHVLAWRELSTDRIVTGPELVLTQPITPKWSVVVSQLPDAAVGVDVLVESYQ